MDCREVRDLLLTDYADGELDGATRGAVERHAAMCPACRRFAEQVRAVAVAPLRGAGVCDAPPSLRGKVMRAIEAERRRSERSWRVLRWGWLPTLRRPVYAVAAAAAVLVAVFLARSSPLGRRTAPAAGGGDLLYAYLVEQSSALASPNGNGTGNGGDSATFGTVVEEYLM